MFYNSFILDTEYSITRWGFRTFAKANGLSYNISIIEKQFFASANTAQSSCSKIVSNLSKLVFEDGSCLIDRIFEDHLYLYIVSKKQSPQESIVERILRRGLFNEQQAAVTVQGVIRLIQQAHSKGCSFGPIAPKNVVFKGTSATSALAVVGDCSIGIQSIFDSIVDNQEAMPSDDAMRIITQAACDTASHSDLYYLSPELCVEPNSAEGNETTTSALLQNKHLPVELEKEVFSHLKSTAEFKRPLASFYSMSSTNNQSTNKQTNNSHYNMNNQHSNKIKHEKDGKLVVSAKVDGRPPPPDEDEENEEDQSFLLYSSIDEHTKNPSDIFASSEHSVTEGSGKSSHEMLRYITQCLLSQRVMLSEMPSPNYNPQLFTKSFLKTQNSNSEQNSFSAANQFTSLPPPSINSQNDATSPSAMPLELDRYSIEYPSLSRVLLAKSRILAPSANQVPSRPLPLAQPPRLPYRSIPPPPIGQVRSIRPSLVSEKVANSSPHFGPSVPQSRTGDSEQHASYRPKSSPWSPFARADVYQQTPSNLMEGISNNLSDLNTKDDKYDAPQQLRIFGDLLQQNNSSATDLKSKLYAESLISLQATEVWSVGCLAYLLLVGYPPFYCLSRLASIKRIKKCEFDIDSSFWDCVTSEAQDFVSACMHEDPKMRPLPSALLKHPWIENLGPSSSNVSSQKIASHGPASALVNNLTRYLIVSQLEDSIPSLLAVSRSSGSLHALLDAIRYVKLHHSSSNFSRRSSAATLVELLDSLQWRPEAAEVRKIIQQPLAGNRVESTQAFIDLEWLVNLSIRKQHFARKRNMFKIFTLCNPAMDLTSVSSSNGNNSSIICWRNEKLILHLKEIGYNAFTQHNTLSTNYQKSATDNKDVKLTIPNMVSKRSVMHPSGLNYGDNGLNNSENANYTIPAVSDFPSNFAWVLRGGAELNGVASRARLAVELCMHSTSLCPIIWHDEGALELKNKWIKRKLSCGLSVEEISAAYRQIDETQVVKVKFSMGECTTIESFDVIAQAAAGEAAYGARSILTQFLGLLGQTIDTHEVENAVLFNSKAVISWSSFIALIDRFEVESLKTDRNSA